MNLGKIIVPLGISAYTMVLITFISGLYKMELQKHKLLACISLTLATMHAVLVIYTRFF